MPTRLSVTTSDLSVDNYRIKAHSGGSADPEPSSSPCPGQVSARFMYLDLGARKCHTDARESRINRNH